MSAFASGELSGQGVAELETLLRTAIFKPANALVGYLLQQALERMEDSY